MRKNCLYKIAKILLVPLFTLLFFVAIKKTTVDAVTSQTINFQGKIVRNDTGYEGLNITAGSPSCVVDGGADTCDFKVTYYDGTTTFLYEETFSNVEIGDYGGVFNLSLGSGVGGSTADLCGDGDDICDSLLKVVSTHSDVYVELEFAPNGTTLTETFAKMPLQANAYSIFSKYSEGAADAFKFSQTLSSASSGSPVAGMVYYNTSSNTLKLYNGSEWKDLSTGLPGSSYWSDESIGSWTWAQFMESTGIGSLSTFSLDTTNKRVSVNGDGAKSGLSVYSSYSGATDWPLVSFKADGASFTGSILQLVQDGTGKILQGYKGSDLSFEFDNVGDLHLNSDGAIYFESFASAPTTMSGNTGEGCIYSYGGDLYWNADCDGSVGTEELLNGAAAGGSLWSDGGAFTYLTATGDDLIFGGSTIADATFVFDVDASGGTFFEIDNADNSSRIFTIDSSGNVGIGTGTPGAKLDIGGAASVISNTSGDITITPAQNLIISSGNVGIGVSSPLYKLDISGYNSWYEGAVHIAIQDVAGPFYTDNVYNEFTMSHASGGSGSMNGVRNEGTTNSDGSVTGVYNEILQSASVTTESNSTVYGVNNYVRVLGAATWASGYGTYTSMVAGNDAYEQDMWGNYSKGLTYANDVMYNYYAASNASSNGGTQYAYYANMANGTATKWGLYLSGETQNYISGSLGIGDSTPTVALDVAGAIGTSRLGIYGTYNSAEVQGIWSIGQAYNIDTVNDTFGDQYGMGYAYSTNAGAPFATTHQIVFTNNGTIGASIGLNGKAYFAGPVGIGATDPGYALDVSGQLRIRNANYHILFYDTDTSATEWALSTVSNTGFGIFEDASTARLIVEAGGNVGIGGAAISDPLTNLHIDSSVNTALRVSSSSETAYPGIQIYKGTTTNNDWWAMYVRGNNHYFAIGNYDSGGADRLLIEPGGTVHMPVAHGADYAETINVRGKVYQGQIVSITNDSGIVGTLTKDKQMMLGIISSKPAMVIDTKDGAQFGYDPKPVYENEKAPIALNGQVPVIVTLENGSIKAGDSITLSSNIAGVGTKAVTAGQIVAKALEPFLSTSTCKSVTSINAINWPQDDGTNPLKPCYKLPDGTFIGKVMSFVNLSWYDPFAAALASDNITITPSKWYRIAQTDSPNASGVFKLVNTTLGSYQTTEFTAVKGSGANSVNVKNNTYSNKQVFSAVRVVTEGNTAYLEIYIDDSSDNKVSSSIYENSGWSSINWLPSTYTGDTEVFSLRGISFNVDKTLVVSNNLMKVTGDIISSSQSDLGNGNSRWNNVYASGSIRLGSSGSEGSIRYNIEKHQLEFSNDGTTWMALGDLKSQNTLSPEYPGAVLYADGTENSGTMTSDVDDVNDKYLNYYQWSTDKSTLQDYDILVRVTLPDDFIGWNEEGITLDYVTENSASIENNKVDMYLYGQETNVSADGQSTDNISKLAGQWQRTTIKGSDMDQCDKAGETCVLRIVMSAKDSYYVRVGDIVLNYNRSL